jgi:DNA polymerase-3 subunit delta'
MSDKPVENLQADAWKALLAKRARLPHALLVHGVAGVGKLALAERFAQALLCESAKPGGGPCGACEACRWFLAGNHPDMRFVEPEAMARHVAQVEEGDEPKAKEAKPSTQIKIEQTRALANFIHLGSHRGGLRIALIHPAEEMNIATANSLLKSLEEPPPGAIFILVSHRPARLLPTIRSRCVPVPVPLPPRDAALAWIAAQGVRQPERWLAFAGGAPLRALEYATGERGAVIEQLLRALAAGDRAALAAAGDRDNLEPLTEMLQKLAMDRAFAALTGKGKYALGSGGSKTVDAKAWLACAREMGRHRLLARHPLNPKLFAYELASSLPDL